ncbi:glycosyltransferase [Aulosira sp. FACHB-615]|uniref:glycosyltransferase n=1 Tax=Aulosira sp. FACHB-615 TaxID=2692777 RepID=UPI001685CF8F|nr:glycosyltransferase [Aulosira sp. FACHB-615]MBD2491108.1 hypothetical protein [Aulosira sp. FACHB-615]
MKSGNGFVYVATGQGYRDEALKSADTLKRSQPGAKICLVTDKAPQKQTLFDDVVVVESENVTFSPLDKTLAVRCPYERVVFLDTDTSVVGELKELFEILNGFEIALLPETKRGWDYELPDVPQPFAEFNTGVIVFRNDARINALFEQWRQMYQQLRQNPGLVNDQPSFRRVLFHSDIRVAPLPSEFHFLGNTENYIMWDARLIHARGDLEAIASQVNRRLGSRVYIPDVGTLQGFNGRLSWAIKLLNFFWNGIQLLWRKPTDSAGMNPGKWWLKEKRTKDAQV